MTSQQILRLISFYHLTQIDIREMKQMTVREYVLKYNTPIDMPMWSGLQSIPPEPIPWEDAIKSFSGWIFPTTDDMVLVPGDDFEDTTGILSDGVLTLADREATPDEKELASQFNWPDEVFDNWHIDINIVEGGAYIVSPWQEDNNKIIRVSLDEEGHIVSMSSNLIPLKAQMTWAEICQAFPGTDGGTIGAWGGFSLRVEPSEAVLSPIWDNPDDITKINIVDPQVTSFGQADLTKLKGHGWSASQYSPDVHTLTLDLTYTDKNYTIYPHLPRLDEPGEKIGLIMAVTGGVGHIQMPDTFIHNITANMTWDDFRSAFGDRTGDGFTIAIYNEIRCAQVNGEAWGEYPYGQYPSCGLSICWRNPDNITKITISDWAGGNFTQEEQDLFTSRGWTVPDRYVHPYIEISKNSSNIYRFAVFFPTWPSNNTTGERTLVNICVGVGANNNKKILNVSYRPAYLNYYMDRNGYDGYQSLLAPYSGAYIGGNNALSNGGSDSRLADYVYRKKDADHPVAGKCVLKDWTYSSLSDAEKAMFSQAGYDAVFPKYDGRIEIEQFQNGSYPSGRPYMVTYNEIYHIPISIDWASHQITRVAVNDLNPFSTTISSVNWDWATFERYFTPIDQYGHRVSVVAGRVNWRTYGDALASAASTEVVIAQEYRMTEGQSISYNIIDFEITDDIRTRFRDAGWTTDLVDDDLHLYFLVTDASYVTTTTGLGKATPKLIFYISSPNSAYSVPVYMDLENKEITTIARKSV